MNVKWSAGKFSIVPTLLKLCTRLALLWLATIICNILNCHSKRVFPSSNWFVEREEAFTADSNMGFEEQQGEQVGVN